MSDDVVLDLGSAVPYALHTGIAPEPREICLVVCHTRSGPGERGDELRARDAGLLEQPVQCAGLDFAMIEDYAAGGATTHDDVTASLSYGRKSEGFERTNCFSTGDTRQVRWHGRELRSSSVAACHTTPAEILRDRAPWPPEDWPKHRRSFRLGQPQDARQSPAFPTRRR